MATGKISVSQNKKRKVEQTQEDLQFKREQLAIRESTIVAGYWCKVIWGKRQGWSEGFDHKLKKEHLPQWGSRLQRSSLEVNRIHRDMLDADVFEKLRVLRAATDALSSDKVRRLRTCGRKLTVLTLAGLELPDAERGALIQDETLKELLRQVSLWNGRRDKGVWIVQIAGVLNGAVQRCLKETTLKGRPRQADTILTQLVENCNRRLRATAIKGNYANIYTNATNLDQSATYFTRMLEKLPLEEEEREQKARVPKNLTIAQAELPNIASRQ